MIPLSTAFSGGLTFSSNWRGFELKQNDQTVGALRCQTMWSSSFEASTPQDNWIIRRGGFWGNKAEVLDIASQQPIAHFKSAWGGKGALTFADGQTFLVVTRGIWHPVWTVTTEAALPVLELHTREKSVALRSLATIPDNRLALLVLFTLYRVRQAEEAAAAAVAAAS
jgi:hypothetical protein